MNRRALLVAGGCGITAFLLVAVGVIELLDFEFSAIVGLPVGVVAGLLTAAFVAAGSDRLGAVGRHLLDGAAGFGYAVALLLAVRYVDLAGLRSVISVQRLLGLALATAVLALVLSWQFDRRSPS